jgi:hypothetical protein
MMHVEYQLGVDGQLHPLKTEASRAPVRLLPALHREMLTHRHRRAQRNVALVRRQALVFTTATGRRQSSRNALRAVHKAGVRGA